MRHSAFSALAATLAATAAPAQPPIAEYYGFEPERIILVDDGAGPVAIGDMNADERPDIVVANNRKSRIEIHSLRAAPRTTAEIERDYEVNELPPNEWYDRSELIVRDRVAALAITDFDADGLADLLVLSASPVGLVAYRQHAPGQFEEASRDDRSNLNTGALAVADLDADGRDELAAILDGELSIWEIDEAGRFAEPQLLGDGDGVRKLLTGDFDGDGRTDILAVAPGATTPLRLWRHQSGSLGALPTVAMRFAVPNVQDAGVVPGDPDAIAVIENGTRRHLVYRFTESEPGESRVARIIALPGAAANGRPLAIADLDGDGANDAVALDADANETVILWQLQGAGLSLRTAHPTFKEPAGVAVGRWGGRDDPAVFVLSEAESAVGVSWFDEPSGNLSFPEPIVLATAGATPVAMRSVLIDGQSVLMVIAKRRRDFVLEAHRWSENSAEPATIELDGVTRAPQSILAYDADRDGVKDLLLLTPGEPMLMVLGESGAGAWRPGELRDRDAMKQFGLVQAAGPNNTAIRDLDGDETPELLIGDDNFVRACVYDDARGWRVIEQHNLEPDAAVVSLALDGDRLLVGESSGIRVLKRDGGAWTDAGEIKIEGVTVGPMHAGRFTGDDTPSALIVDGASLALIALEGPGHTLSADSVYRPDAENRFEHEIAAGDINADGYTDLVTLDAREQMCSILSIADSGRIVPATEFKVFESRLFSRGESMEFEPSLALIDDLSGDAKDDLLFLVHDRIIVYPQASGR